MESCCRVRDRRVPLSVLPPPRHLQGPAAGVPVTSTGLFADVLRLARTLAEWAIPTIT